MKLKISEKDLQKTTIEYLIAKRIFHYRNNSGAFKRDGHFYRFGATGSPDIVAVINGQYVGLEIKGTGGKQSEHQREFQENLEAAGGRYLLISELNDLDKI